MRRLFFCILLAFFAYLAMAETASAQSQADETIDLNITERRIAEPNYRASTSVEIGPDQTRGVWLRVGVGVFANNIEVLLRNVTGRVRFRGTLEPVLRRINQRRPN
jgi:hypothetical protein